MAVEFRSREISEKYDRFARWYDWLEGIPDLLGIRRLRRSLLSRASGSILEVAVGTGKNLAYYPHDCRITAMDISRNMLNVAHQRAAKLSMHVSFSLADAGVLPLPTTLLILLFLPSALAHFQIRLASFKRWRAFVERAVRSCYWSMAEAITSGWDIGRTGMPINLSSRLAATGTESH